MGIKQHYWMARRMPEIYLSTYWPKTTKAWGRLTKKRYVTIKNRRIWKWFFEAYLWLMQRDNLEYERREVCDHLGPIDTLGWRRDQGRWTSSFSSEMESVFAIHLGPFCIELDAYSHTVVFLIKRRQI
jgi:hypothetical protein